MLRPHECCDLHEHNLGGWRIYYGDGSTFSSADGSWEEAPERGVQGFTVFTVDTYQTRTLENRPWKWSRIGCDYYFKHGYCFGGTNIPHDLPADLLPGAVKEGQEIDWESFRAIRQAMYNDYKRP